MRTVVFGSNRGVVRRNGLLSLFECQESVFEFDYAAPCMCCFFFSSDASFARNGESIRLGEAYY